MTIFKVLGIGCSNCENTVTLLEAVALEAGVAIHVEKVEGRLNGGLSL